MTRVLCVHAQMVWDECKSIQNSSGILGTFKHSPKCAWRAFEGLLATGLAFHVDQGAEAKVCAWLSEPVLTCSYFLLVSLRFWTAASDQSIVIALSL